MIWANTNPRYVAYCLAHGAASPQQMLVRDRQEWPGGIMCGFTLWVRAQWQEWKRETRWRGPLLSEADHVDFDAWLRRRLCA